MKNGNLELFDDVMTSLGMGQIRHIDHKGMYFVALDDTDYEWMDIKRIEFCIPKTPIMVCVSDISEEDAIINQSVEWELICEHNGNYVCTVNNVIYKWKYAVPVNSVKAKPKTVSKQQIKEAQDLIEALINGAVVEGD